MRILQVALVALVGCVGSGSAERQAQGRAGDGDVEEGPLEQVVTDRMEAADARRAAAAGERAAVDRAADERAMSAAAAWDLRLLDLLAVQLDVTQDLAESVAEHGETQALRDWAEEEVVDAAHWRRELAVLRATWYGDPRPPALSGSPTLSELGPVTRELAERDAARDLVPPDAIPEEPVVPEAPEEAVRGAISTREAVYALVQNHRRAVAAATAGTMQASREELRALSLRIQLGEQQSLVRLVGLLEEDRG